MKNAIKEVKEGIFTAYVNSVDKIKNLPVLILAAFATALMPLPSMASALDGVLTSIGGLCITVIAIVGVIVLVKQSAEHVKGTGVGIGKIITTVLVILLLIGLVVTLMNISALQDLFGGIAGKAVETTGNVAQEALG